MQTYKHIPRVIQKGECLNMTTLIYEQFDHINQWGKAMTPDGHEFRDEQGQIVIVPDNLIHLFNILEESV